MAELVWNKKTYEIKKKTVDVSDRLDEIIEMAFSDDRKEKRKAFKAEYDFIMDIMGEDNAHEALDCTGFNDVDVEILITLLNAIGYAWQKVRRSFDQLQAEESASNPLIDRALDLSAAVDKLQELK